MGKLDDSFVHMERARISGAIGQVLDDALSAVQAQIDRNVDTLIKTGTLTGDLALVAVAERAALRSVHKRMEQNISVGESASRQITPQMEGRNG